MFSPEGALPYQPRAKHAPSGSEEVLPPWVRITENLSRAL